MDCLYVSFDVHSIEGIKSLSPAWQCAFLLSIAPILVALLAAVYWTADNHRHHPIARRLSLFDASDYAQVATAINTEYRRFDKFAVCLGGVRRLIVTDSWIIWTSTYTVHFAQQQDTTVNVIGSDQHVVSHHSTTHEHDVVQFLNIEVHPVNQKPFVIRFVDLECVHQRSRT